LLHVSVESGHLQVFNEISWQDREQQSSQLAWCFRCACYMSRNFFKSGNNHFLLHPFKCTIHCISNHLALPASELLEMSLNKLSKKWLQCYMNCSSVSIHLTCNAPAFSFKDLGSVYWHALHITTNNHHFAVFKMAATSEK
jgi:hypothetical protein